MVLYGELDKGRQKYYKFYAEQKVRYKEIDNIAYRILKLLINDEDDAINFKSFLQCYLIPHNLRDFKFKLRDIDRIYYSFIGYSHWYVHKRRDDYIIFRVQYNGYPLYVQLVIFDKYSRDVRVVIKGFAFITTDSNFFFNFVLNSKKEEQTLSIYQSLLKLDWEKNNKIENDSTSYPMFYFGPDKNIIYQSLRDDGIEINSLQYWCYKAINNNRNQLLPHYSLLSNGLKNNIKDFDRAKEMYERNMRSIENERKEKGGWWDNDNDGWLLYNIQNITLKRLRG